MTKEMKNLIKLVIIAVLFVISVGFVYNLGYNKAIHNAHLVSVNENNHNSYIIGFSNDDKNNNVYEGDWVELYTEPTK